MRMDQDGAMGNGCETNGEMRKSWKRQSGIDRASHEKDPVVMVCVREE